MNCEDLEISQAARADLREILALLTEAGLPHEGVPEHLGGFLVARDGGGRLAGAVGLERHGSVGLLRSAVVTPGLRRAGAGSCLVSALLERAASEGLEKVVLLTSTARDFFARRFGFAEADRAEFDELLAGSREWRLPRCSTAVCMALDLKDVRRPRTDRTAVRLF